MLNDSSNTSARYLQVIVSCFFISAIIIFISCKREYSCEDCAEKNKPPIADAGPEQVIKLPTDSALLDGRSSSDPDGKISSYLWKKISGPFSSTIIKPTDSITKVKALVLGTYQFELKVTDNAGLSAKDTVKIVVDSVLTTNHPPVANAGADQTITLPTNTVNLDASASTDPDNNIASYKWAKISGPSTFSISNANGMQTSVTNLVQGVYHFELKVTDAVGLSSNDTINIVVISLATTSSIDVIGCNATMVPFEHLPSAIDIVHTAAAANKILFIPYTNNGVVYIYDTTTHGWQTVSNMSAVYGQSYNDNATTIGSKIIFSSPNYTGYGQFTSQVINIYNATADSWSTNVLSEGREGYTKAVVGSKVYYAGGRIMDSPYVSKKIDIYDATSNSWSSQYFPDARMGMEAVSRGNRIYFSGGFITRYDSLVLGYDDFGNSFWAPAVVASDRIDIWDVGSNTWSLAQLCEARGNIATAVVGDKIVFASGQNNTTTSAKADIYNTTSNSWTSATLAGMGNGVIKAYSVGNKVLVTYLGSNKIDIYDATNNTWLISQMPQQLISSAQERMKGVVVGNKILLYTIFTTEPNSKNVDMYDADTNQWCHALLSNMHIRAGVMSYGGRIYIAGGSTESICCIYDTLLDTVWFFHF